ncbi:MAG: peptidoglycan editing factor PgeF [Proteobacteria bacterium]|nr:peptidoglycan editing factor PgeF [Pseudomonadota bacterium]
MLEELLHWDELGTPHGFETRHGDLTSALPAPMLRLRQVHGAKVHVINADTEFDDYTAAALEDRPAGDARVTATHGLTVCVMTADCVPLLVHDPIAGVVGAAHAGWRGIVAGVVGATLSAMVEKFGARPANCRAAVGPCVGAAAYKVGPEVGDAFRALGLPDDLFRAAEAGEDERPTTWLCDLGQAVAWQLRDAGLSGGAIWHANRCTLGEASVFHSYRRDGETAGRMTSGVALF